MQPVDKHCRHQSATNDHDYLQVIDNDAENFSAVQSENHQTCVSDFGYLQIVDNDTNYMQPDESNSNYLEAANSSDYLSTVNVNNIIAHQPINSTDSAPKASTTSCSRFDVDAVTQASCVVYNSSDGDVMVNQTLYSGSESFYEQIADNGEVILHPVCENLPISASSVQSPASKLFIVSMLVVASNNHVPLYFLYFYYFLLFFFFLLPFKAQNCRPTLKWYFTFFYCNKSKAKIF